MTHDPARMATDALAAQPIEIGAPSEEARRKAIEALTEALRARRQQRRRRGWITGASLAAAAAVLGIFLLSRRTVVRPPPAPELALEVKAQEPSAGVRWVRDGKESAMHAGNALLAGDHVVVPDGAAAALDLSSGTHVGIGSGSELAVVDTSARQTFAVLTGSADFHVAKLGAGQRFLVRTPDAEIEVRGTDFHVEILAMAASCHPSRTRLVVREGTVVIRHASTDASIAAGERWPSGCLAQAAPPSPTEPPPAIEPTASAPAKPSVSAPPSPTSDLASQNDLLARAMAAKRRGEVATALAGFEQFLAKYPGSPSAEVATAERMRLLSGARKTEAAKAYLLRYPKGFAREEATAIVGKGG